MLARLPVRNHLCGQSALVARSAERVGRTLGRREGSVGAGQRGASGVVRQALAVRAAGERRAAEEQLGIARHTTEPTDHVLGGCRALALSLLGSGSL